MKRSAIDIILIVIVIFLVICTLGFGIYACVEYSKRNEYMSNDYICGSFKNITTMTMDKDIWSMWHWTYISTYGSFVQKCPTFTHDADIYKNGQLAMRTNGKIASLVTKTELNDCHGNTQYIIQTGSLFQTIINTNKIWVSLLLQYPNETTIAYVDSSIFIVGNIHFKDLNGNIIATASKSIDGAHWQWTYNLYTTIIDLAPIVAITSKLSFSPAIGEKDSKTDVCNQFFLGAGITALILLCLLFIGACVWIYYLSKNKKICDTSYLTS